MFFFDTQKKICTTVQKSLQQGIYVCSGIKMSFFIYSCMIRSNLGFADFLRV